MIKALKASSRLNKKVQNQNQQKLQKKWVLAESPDTKSGLRISRPTSPKKEGWSTSGKKQKLTETMSKDKLLEQLMHLDNLLEST